MAEKITNVVLSDITGHDGLQSGKFSVVENDAVEEAKRDGNSVYKVSSDGTVEKVFPLNVAGVAAASDEQLDIQVVGNEEVKSGGYSKRSRRYKKNSKKSKKSQKRRGSRKKY